MIGAAQPRPIPPRFLKPRELTGAYPFRDHRTIAELDQASPSGARA